MYKKGEVESDSIKKKAKKNPPLMAGRANGGESVANWIFPAR